MLLDQLFDRKVGGVSCFERSADSDRAVACHKPYLRYYVLTPQTLGTVG